MCLICKETDDQAMELVNSQIRPVYRDNGSTFLLAAVRRYALFLLAAKKNRTIAPVYFRYSNKKHC